MSIMAVGPALDIDGPLPVKPEHSLLETMIRTPDGDLASVVVQEYGLDEVARELNGVNVWGYPTGCSELWEPCSDGTFRTKSEESEQPTPRFDSYAVYKPLTCSGMGMSNERAAELAVRIKRVLDATVSAGVERAIFQGVEGSSNPFIGDSAAADITPVPGTAVSPGVGLSLLENAIGATCRAGMIGATPATIAALQAFPVGSESDRRLVTANGTPVYSADGLIGASTSDLAVAGDGEDWMVAHGPVQIWIGPARADTVRSALDRSDNSLVFRAEQFVLSVFDTALQAAVLVDWAS